MGTVPSHVPRGRGSPRLRGRVLSAEGVTFSPQVGSAPAAPADSIALGLARCPLRTGSWFGYAWSASGSAGAVGRNEELAVRTLEAAVALGLAGDQLRRERLLAMGAHDLDAASSRAGTSVTVPPYLPPSSYGRKKRYVLERRSLRRRRIAARGARGGSSPRNRSPSGRPTASRPAFVRKHARRAPVPGESTRVRGEQHDVDRARRRADVLLVLLQIPDQHGGREDERRRTLELRRFGRSGSLLQPVQGLRAERRGSARDSCDGGSAPSVRARAARRRPQAPRDRDRTTCASVANAYSLRTTPCT